MRALILALVALSATPAVEAKSAKAQCNDRCQVQYRFCLNRSTTKQGKRQCKVDRSKCHLTCPK